MIKERIERLAEINAAGDLIALGDPMRNERKIIIQYLLDENVIVLDENGGFHFIGEQSKSHTKLYLDNYSNF